MDYVAGPGVDVVQNLNKIPYPFEDEQFDTILASHVLEHLSGNWFLTLRELARILKPSGKLIVKVPHFTSPVAYEPFHQRFFRYTSFDKASRKDTSLDQDKYMPFKVLKRKIKFHPMLAPFEIWVNLTAFNAKVYEWTHIFPATELIFELEKEQELKVEGREGREGRGGMD